MNSDPKVCSACGTALVPDQVFCSRCGTKVGVDNGPTHRASESSFIPPPPPPNPSNPYAMGPDTPHYQSGPSHQGYSSPYESGPDYRPPQQQPTPSFAQPPQRRGRGNVGVILLLVVLVLGITGYFTWNALNSRGTATSGTTTSSSGASTTNGTTATTAGGSSAGTTSDVKTTPINKTVTYADDTITILDVKQAKSFTDEKTSGDMLRIDVKEQTGDKAPYFGTYGYSSGFHVILPSGDSVQVANIQASDTPIPVPAAQISRTNWIDFAVPVTTPIEQITLRLGNPNEHQIDIPLTSSADVSKYQSRTATLNKLIHWGGLNWTLTTASWQLSAQGNQADKDMAYVVLSFKVDSAPAGGYLDQAVGDAFRLTADASTTNASKYNTFPQTIAAGESGKTGTVGFLVPQDSTKYTLVMPVYDRGGITSTTQITTDFQIP